MLLSSVIAEFLKENEIDLSKIASSFGSAMAKKQVNRQSVTQSSKHFTASESSKLEIVQLKGHEIHAMEVKAFDDHMAKAAKMWGLAKWELPKPMLEKAKNLWEKSHKPLETTAPVK